MNNLVVSLQLAKLMKAEGFPQETHFAWYSDGELHEQDKTWYGKPIAAPLAEEILRELPKRLHLTREQAKKLIFDLDPKYQRKIDEDKIRDLDDFPSDQLTFHLVVDFLMDGYNFYYEQDYDFPWMINNSTEGYSEYLAEAAGNMYLYLKKNGLLEGGTE